MRDLKILAVIVKSSMFWDMTLLHPQKAVFLIFFPILYFIDNLLLTTAGLWKEGDQIIMMAVMKPFYI